MSQASSFADWLAHLKQGDSAAAEACFERYARRLIGLARVRLEGRLRAKVDPEDVLQSVFKSFFTRRADWELGGWDNLWSLLVVLTVRKCNDQVDRLQAGCRDVRREVALQSRGEESLPSWEALARDPSPEEAAMLGETVEHVMRSLSPQEREILTLRLQGNSVAEISVEVGRTERTVYRVLEHVRAILCPPN
jgi:RNA polymerase sigma-70 factor (ECF subfamily)